MNDTIRCEYICRADFCFDFGTIFDEDATNKINSNFFATCSRHDLVITEVTGGNGTSGISDDMILQNICNFIIGQVRNFGQQILKCRIGRGKNGPSFSTVVGLEHVDKIKPVRDKQPIESFACARATISDFPLILDSHLSFHLEYMSNPHLLKVRTGHLHGESSDSRTAGSGEQHRS